MIIVTKLNAEETPNLVRIMHADIIMILDPSVKNIKGSPNIEAIAKEPKNTSLSPNFSASIAEIQ